MCLKYWHPRCVRARLLPLLQDDLDSDDGFLNRFVAANSAALAAAEGNFPAVQVQQQGRSWWAHLMGESDSGAAGPAEAVSSSSMPSPRRLLSFAVGELVLG